MKNRKSFRVSISQINYGKKKILTLKTLQNENRNQNTILSYNG